MARGNKAPEDASVAHSHAQQSLSLKGGATKSQDQPESRKETAGHRRPEKKERATRKLAPHHRTTTTTKQRYAILEEGLFIRPAEMSESHSNMQNPSETIAPKSSAAKNSRHDAASAYASRNEKHLAGLRALVVSGDKLRENGYILNELTEEELERKKRCGGCGKTMGSLLKRSAKRSAPKSERSGNQEQVVDVDVIVDETNLETTMESIDISSSTPSQQQKFRCRFHPAATLVATVQRRGGRKQSDICFNCNKRFSEPPCSGTEHHQAIEYALGEFEWSWHHYPTPTPSAPRNIRDAVAIDCEMGTDFHGNSELIRVTMIDYFTSAVLVDKLVFPDVPMLHYNTRFSGVTRHAILEAKRNRSCFFGRDNARVACWRFVGPNTVVVGHSANNDLTALRWRHENVVDTVLLDELRPKKEEAEAVVKHTDEHVGGQPMALSAGTESSQTSPNDHPDISASQTAPNIAQSNGKAAPLQTIPALSTDTTPKSKQPKKRKDGPMSLKTLASVKLQRSIQGGKRGHDSLEDAIATRDLAWLVVSERISRD